MDALARQIVQAGIKHVRGDIVGDATAFDEKLIPDGWKTSYLGASYAARVSALSLNENLVWVVVQPNGNSARRDARAGDDDDSGREHGSRGGRQRRSHQRSAPARWNDRRARHHRPSLGPAEVFARRRQSGAVHDRRAPRGAREGGHHGRWHDAASAPSPANATQVAAVASPPLGQIVGEMDRESINIVAELLFRSAAATSNTGRIGRERAARHCASSSPRRCKTRSDLDQRERRQRSVRARPGHGTVDGRAARLRARVGLGLGVPRVAAGRRRVGNAQAPRRARRRAAICTQRPERRTPSPRSADS